MGALVPQELVGSKDAHCITPANCPHSRMSHRIVADTSVGASCRGGGYGPRSARGHNHGFSENEVGVDYPALPDVPDLPWFRFRRLVGTALDPSTTEECSPRTPCWPADRAGGLRSLSEFRHRAP